MKRLLAILLFATTANAALPLCSVNGLIAWDDGLRYVCITGTPNRWSPATTSWRTEAKNALFTVDSQGRETLYLLTGSYTISLQAAAVLGNGYSVAFKNVGGGTIVLDPNSTETIDGSGTYTMLTAQETVEIVSDGSNWHVASVATTNYWARDVANSEIYPVFIGDQVGIGTTNPTSKLNVLDVLGADTGNEVVMTIDYTTNKLTSGNDTAIEINHTDTLSPGISYFINGKVSNLTKFNVSNSGAMQVLNVNSNASDLTLGVGTRTFSIAGTQLDLVGSFTNTSGNATGVLINPAYTNSGAGTNTDLLINRTETTVSTGAQRLIDAQVGSVSKFFVDNVGTIKSTGGHIYNVTNVNAATYDILATDYFLNVSYTSTGAVTNLQLMTAQCNGTEDYGRHYIIKDAGANAGANTITVQTEGTEKIDGADTYVINSNKAAINVYCYANNWYIY